MNPTEWLEQNAPGYAVLSPQEREAIAHFALLWSFFEAIALRSRGSSEAILRLARNWASTGQLDPAGFEDSLAFFQHRYFAHGEPTAHLAGLHLRPNDHPNLVHAVLQGQNTNETERIAALLIIIYRLRNNLFHGAKWAYGIHGQLENFTHANKTLMNALSMAGVP